MKFPEYYKIICKARKQKTNIFVDDFDKKEDRLYEKDFKLNKELKTFLEKIQIY